MSNAKLIGSGGQLQMKIQVKRKDTGLVEEYDLVGKTTPEQHKQIVEQGIFNSVKENGNDGNT